MEGAPRRGRREARGQGGIIHGYGPAKVAASRRALQPIRDPENQGRGRGSSTGQGDPRPPHGPVMVTEHAAHELLFSETECIVASEHSKVLQYCSPFSTALR